MRGFGERLKERAAQLGLSGSGVARRLDLDPTRYNRYENNVNEPGLETLVRIARILEATPNQLLGVEPMPPPPGTPDTREALLDALATAVRTLEDRELRLLAELVRHYGRVRDEEVQGGNTGADWRR
jgi:transcriptional regulator with XRE-family HTH domain